MIDKQLEQERRAAYVNAEVVALADANENYLKLHSAFGSTKWISVTREQVAKIAEILKEPAA